jgi:hypothetical protein
MKPAATATTKIARPRGSKGTAAPDFVEVDDAMVEEVAEAWTTGAVVLPEFC